MWIRYYGMATKDQPTSDGLRICSSFALMMISARQKSQKSLLSQLCFLQPILKQIFFFARTAACNLFLYPLGFAGSSKCKWFIMILESSHGVHSCILKARSQEAHHMTHWTVGIWGRYASVANDGSNLPYSHLLGYAPAGNAKEMVKSWASLMSVEKCGADLRRCVPGCIVCSRIG